jgi:hypothetical protein
VQGPAKDIGCTGRVPALGLDVHAQFLVRLL